MSTPSWSPKDPDEVLDYQIDWTVRLDGDTIDDSTWILPTDLPSVVTKDSATFTDTVTTIWLSDGMLGSSYVLTNRINTAGGRTMDQSVKLQIKAK